MTYNIAERDPHKLVDLNGLFDNGFNHDIYVIALEETHHSLKAMTTMIGNNKYTLVLIDIFEPHGFVLLQREQLTVTALFVFVRKSDKDQFMDIQVGVI